MPLPIFSYPMPQPPGNVNTLGGSLTFDAAMPFDISATVYRKQRWADSWTQDNTLDVLNVTWNAAPQIPIASLRRRYGRCVEKGATSETTRTKQEWRGWYLKIVITCADGDRIWHGFIDDIADEQHGFIARSVANPPPDPPTILQEAAGVQTFSCVGILAALDRAPISRTVYATSSGFTDPNLTNLRVAFSAPQYNVADQSKLPGGTVADAFAGARMPPSRDPTERSRPDLGAGVSGERSPMVHRFDRVYGNAAPNVNRWNLKQILENLVAWNGPNVGIDQWRGPFADDKSEFIPVWIFDHVVLNPNTGDDNPSGATVTQYANTPEPRLDCEGMTLKGALDRLLNTNSGHGYFAWVDESTTPDRVYIEPFSILSSSATYTGDDGATKTIPRAARRIAINAAGDSATAIVTQTNAAEEYTYIAVAGMPETTVCTLTVTDHFDANWASALQTAYDTEIASLNAAVLRDLQRMRDIRELPMYRPIGRHWRIKQTWDWKVGGVDVFQDTAAAARYLPFPLRTTILERLPLKSGIDYAATPTTTPVELHRVETSPIIEPQIYARSFAADGTLTGKWISWTNKAPRDVLYDPNDPAYRLSLSPLEDQLAVGVSIDVDGGFQGALAAGGGRIAPHVPKLDPAQLRLTVAIQSDLLFKVTARRSGTLGGSASNIDAEKGKWFFAGPRLQRIRILTGTIVGINEAADTLKTVPATYYLRDDSALANEVLELLKAYYFVPRQVVRIQTRRPSATLWPGQMITTVNAGTNHAATVNTTITEVAIEMAVGINGQPAPPSMRVQTAFGEIDPLAIFPRFAG
jgi:hypothetical protein